MPSVVFWSGQRGGTAQYRCFTPGAALERAGWEVEVFEDALYVTPELRIKGDPDFLVISRIMGDQVPDIVRGAQRAGTTVVYDTDDWFYGVPDYNPASKLPDVDTMHEAMRLADLVTCSTPALAAGYGDLNRTVVLPNYLDPDIWSDNEKYRQPHDGIHLGWMGAFHWRGGDLELLKPWLPRFLDEHPDVTLVTAGSPELFDYLGVDGLTTPDMTGETPTALSKHLRPYQHLPAMLAHFDIGLVPLTDNRFNRCKSWAKGLEYGAMGVPSVATASPEYRSFIRPGVNGLLARKGNWAKQVAVVMRDLDVFKVGAAKVAKEYMIDDHVWRWEQAYRLGADLRQGRHVSAGVR